MYLVCQPKYTKKTGMKTVFNFFSFRTAFLWFKWAVFLLSSRAK